MPAIITHYLFALDCAQGRLSYEGDKKMAFDFGAQGPDVLFFHRVLPWQRGENLRKYGSLLHKEDPGRLLDLIREYPALATDEIARAYADGLLCHYALDSTAHPFVTRGVEALKEAGEKPLLDNILHQRIESALDVISLREKWEKNPTQVRLKQFIPTNDRVKQSIAGLYAFLLEKKYGLTDTFDKLVEAQRDMITVMKWIDNSSLVKMSFVKFFERCFHVQGVLSSLMRPIMEEEGWDYANVSHGEWADLNPPHALRTDSFFDLWEQAVARYASLREAFWQGTAGQALTQNINFDGMIAREVAQ